MRPGDIWQQACFRKEAGIREGESDKTDKSVLSKKKKESCPLVAGGRDYADGVSERVRQMPSVCLEKASDHSILGIALRDNRSLYLKLSGQTTLVNKKLGLEMVKICPA